MEEKEKNNKVKRNIKETVPEEDRPREKAKKHGFGSLSTAELLAILLRVGTPGESVVDLCQRILRDNDDKLYLIARKGINNLVKNYHGIGEVKAIEILAALELARRYQQEEFQERFKITSSEEAYQYLRPRMEHLDHEEMMVVLLNHAKQVEECVRVSSGGTAMTVADIKMILRPAIERLSSGIILAHNPLATIPAPAYRTTASPNASTRPVRSWTSSWWTTSSSAVETATTATMTTPASCKRIYY